MTRTAEFVTPKHPDKLCDQIADTLLDEYLKQDPKSRVAIEVLGSYNQINITGEVTSQAQVEIEIIVSGLVGNEFKIISNLNRQSPEIAQGVDTGGAGDQGIVVGYACNETPALMPLEYVMARDLCQQLYEKFPVDGKVQVTLVDHRPTVVVASFQNVATATLEAEVRNLIPNAKDYYINPAGDWHIGGFTADAGTVGRKLMIDNYGPRVRCGGGAFSGKDLSKTDRSGAYYARSLAVQLLTETQADEAEVELAYAIGVPHPIAHNVELKNPQRDFKLDNLIGNLMGPTEFTAQLKLNKFSFANTAKWGHFGNNFPWEKNNQDKQL